MKIGAMTNPQRDLLDEIRQVAAGGFDYVDITLEAPKAEPGQIDTQAARRLRDELGVGVICHAAPYLPVHNPSALVRRAALDELRRSLADRLVHVHLSDNDGTADQHLPAGSTSQGGR